MVQQPNLYVDLDVPTIRPHTLLHTTHRLPKLQTKEVLPTFTTFLTHYGVQHEPPMQKVRYMWIS